MPSGGVKIRLPTRDLVDVVVEAEPGTSFGVSGSWHSPAFDIMVRVEQEFWSSTPANWELHEDPNVPRPLPVLPDFSSLLPEFNWPVDGF